MAGGIESADHKQSWEGPPRLCVDCTQTMKTSAVTGIQRVVRNLVKHGRVAAHRRGVELLPIQFTGRFFELAPLSDEGELKIPERHIPNGAIERFGHRLKKIFVGRSVRRQFSKLQGFFARRQSSESRFTFRSSDILLLPDSSWSEPMWAEIDKAMEQGVSLGVLQHDFIPLRYPELVSPESTAIFERWVDESLGRADFVLGVSETISGECREKLQKLGRKHIAENRVRACLNGSNFKAASSTAVQRPEIVRFIDRAPDGPYLTVGTIEPRKNQGLLADIFDDVFHAAPDARFLIAGIVGWEGKAIADRIRRHPRYGKNILLVTDLSDAELTYAYERAKAVVFPSLAEGFGLPIAESIIRGTPVFASHIPVHQEIGGAYCAYFDPRDSRSLTHLLVEYSKGGKFPAVWPPVDFRLPTWQESAEKVIATSLEMARTRRSERSESHDRKKHHSLRAMHASPATRIEKIPS